MKRRASVIVAVLTTALVALIIATRDTSEPSDFGGSDEQPGVGDVVARGQDWTLESFDDFGGCFALRVDGATTRCQSLTYSPGAGTTMQFSGNGRRFALFVYGSADPLSGRWFSNTRRATPIVAHEIGAVIAFVVELDPGEDPFGLQVVDEDGAVVSAVSFVS